MEDTPAPGESGNSVISGHRDTFFRHLNDLQTGDEVLIQRGGKTFHYKVTGKRVVPPTDCGFTQLLHYSMVVKISDSVH